MYIFFSVCLLNFLIKIVGLFFYASLNTELKYYRNPDLQCDKINQFINKEIQKTFF